ncbi:MAG: argininosuccinate lyase [Candidatus Limnocylindria bacterium]
MDDRGIALLGGRHSGSPGDLALTIGSSMAVDLPLATFDIEASRAHVDELARLGLISAPDGASLASALDAVDRSLADGTFSWNERDEDIHMNIEAAVSELVGAELAGQLQAGRSRNEEVVTDERMWLRSAVARLDDRMLALQRTLVERAGGELDTPLPAHTHTQPAQPVLLAHHLLAYVEMVERDRRRLADLAARADRCPAGSGAAAGSGLALDRDGLAQRLGFGGPTPNSLDAVADRDYAVELVAACAIGAGHLSRMSAELVLWSTPYVGFARLPDAFSSGSSMLPNKRNPDAAELVRARAARAAGAVTALLNIVGGLPMAYHRDFQETRAPMLESVASLDLSLAVVRELFAGVTFQRGPMRAAATRGHGLAIGLAERLLAAGVPFRAAHRRVAELVAVAEERGVDLAEMPRPELCAALPELCHLPAIVPSLDEALRAADVMGGTAPGRVQAAVRAAAARYGLEPPRSGM